jgi:hypothetical protein
MNYRYQQQHQDEPGDSEVEGYIVYDDEKSPTSRVNHHGRNALYTVAYFAFLSVLMYPTSCATR